MRFTDEYDPRIIRFLTEEQKVARVNDPKTQEGIAFGKQMFQLQKDLGEMFGSPVNMEINIVDEVKEDYTQEEIDQTAKDDIKRQSKR